jgi:restriction system protein
MALWLVRCGHDKALEQQLLETGFVGIGWSKLEDISRYVSREDFEKYYIQTFPEEKPNAVKTNISQVFRFAHVLEIGDIVAMPLRSTPAIAFGRVVGEYFFDPSAHSNTQHRRRVEWVSEGIPRVTFEKDLLNMFGAFLTFCKIERNNAEERVNAILAGRHIPFFEEAQVDELEVALINPDERNWETFAMEQIRARISDAFDGHSFADLVGELLEAEGLTIAVSEPGPDGGVDILAGSGKFGFESPQIAVQVKHGTQMVDVKVIREHLGVMKTFNASSGLIVSWGGYRGNAKKEARQHFLNTRLWDSEDVVNLITKHYDYLSDQVKEKLPLKRIWALVPDQD